MVDVHAPPGGAPGGRTGDVHAPPGGAPGGRTGRRRRSSGGGVSTTPTLTREEIAEAERIFAEGVASAEKISIEKQKAELARVEKILGGRRTAYGPTSAQAAAERAAATREFAGPVRPGVDVEVFRKIGVSILRPPTKKQEIFVPRLGGFVQADASGQFLDITPTIRPPTEEEKKELEKTTKEKLKEMFSIFGAPPTAKRKVKLPFQVFGVPPKPDVSKVKRIKVGLPPTAKKDVGLPFKVFGVPPKPDVSKVKKFTPSELLSMFGGPPVSKRDVKLPFDVFGVPPKPDVSKVKKFTPKEVIGMLGRPPTAKRDVGLPFDIYGVPDKADASKIRKFTPAELLRMFGAPPTAKRDVELPFKIFGVPPKPDVSKRKGLIKVGLPDTAKRDVKLPFQVFGVSPKPDVTKVKKFTPSELLSIFGAPPVSKRDVGLPFKVVGVPPKPDVSKVKKLDIPGAISDIKEIRRLNIEAKERGDPTFQFISTRGTIETVPTSITFVGASLGVAGKAAEALSLESGLAEFAAQQRIADKSYFISEMAEAEGFREGMREPTKEEIKEEAKLIGRHAEGVIGFGLVDVPLFTAGGVLLSKGLGVATKSGRAARTLEKFAKKPIKKEVTLEAQLKKIEKQRKIIERESRKRIAEELRMLKIGPKKKGILKVQIEKPTGEFRGEVREIIKVGLFKKPKELLGKVTLSKTGEYKEVLDLGKGLKKVTKVTKDGKTTISLIKNGKKITEREADSITASSLKLKKQKFKRVRERQIGGEGVVVERRGIDIFGKKAKEKEIIQEGRLKTLRAEEIKKLTLEAGEDIQTGIRREVATSDELFDIAVSGPRRGVIAIKAPGKKAVIKKEVGQKIEVSEGIPKPDEGLVEFLKIRKLEVLKKAETPKIDREILLRQRQKIKTTFEDPKYAKLNKQLFKEDEIKTIKKRKELLKKLKEEEEKIKALRLKKEINKLKKESIKKTDSRLLLLEKQKSKLAEKLKIPTKVFIEPAKKILGKIAKPKAPTVPFVLGIKPAVKLTPKLIALTAVATKELTKQKEMTKQLTEIMQDTKIIQQKMLESEISTGQIQEKMLEMKTKTKQVAMLRPATRTITKKVTTKISPPITKPILKPIVVPIITKKEVKPTPKKKPKKLIPSQQFYMPEAKRNNLWVKLAATGLTKSAARGRGARAVDNTIAGRFRIRKVAKGSPKIIDNYFAFNKKKFRGYKIVKGEKIPMKDKWIERRGPARIDSVGEREQLSIAKFMKKKGWKSKPKKKPKAKKVMGTKMRIPVGGII